MSWIQPAHSGDSGSVTKYRISRRESGCGEAFTNLGEVEDQLSYSDASLSGLDEGIYLYVVQAINGSDEVGPPSLPVEIHTDGTMPTLAWAGNDAICDSYPDP